jgi:hypothetical protein
MPRKPDLVHQFIALHPTVEGYTLICVLEHINRAVKGNRGIDFLLEQALSIPTAADYLVRVCERFQSQKTV